MIILYAIPLFILLIIVEAIYDRIKAAGYYRFNDAVGSLSTGMLNRTMDFVVLYLNWATYSHFFSWFSYFSLPDSIWVWFLAFVIYDFFYYWSHRIDHMFSLFWNAHAVHHQSEEFNLTTALRQPFSGFVKGSLVYLPMVFLGFDPLVVATVGSLNLVYQFWVHTRFVPKLGVIEKVFVTPSNHRVHHGMNDLYIDKNFGGVFILWDRLFKTFQDELDDEPVIFGVRKQLNSFNPFYANFQIYWQMLKDIWIGRSLKTAWQIVTSKTAYRPDVVVQRAPIARLNLNTFQPYNPTASNIVKMFAWTQLLFALGYTVWFLLFIDLTQFTVALLHFLPLGLVLLSVNYLLEGRAIGWLVEAIRLIYIGIAVYFLGAIWPTSLAMGYMGLASLCFLLGFLSSIKMSSNETSSLT